MTSEAKRTIHFIAKRHEARHFVLKQPEGMTDIEFSRNVRSVFYKVESGDLQTREQVIHAFAEIGLVKEKDLEPSLYQDDIEIDFYC